MLAIGRDLGERGALRGLTTAARTDLIEAPTGNEGLRAFYEVRPDIVVLDLDLADADGFDVLATIRELSDVPLIALSGRDGEAERVRGLRAGADDCLTKPTAGPTCRRGSKRCCGGRAAPSSGPRCWSTTSSRSTKSATGSKCWGSRST